VRHADTSLRLIVTHSNTHRTHAHVALPRPRQADTTFDDYADPDAGDEYSYAGMQFSSGEEGDDADVTEA
jgi:hypothetical protein